MVLTFYKQEELLQMEQKGLSFQVGENRGDLIKTKTIQSNTTGLKLTTLKKSC